MAARLARVLRRLDALKDWERAPRVGMADEVTARSCADLLSLLGEPQQRFRHVHVSGSKGKGSTCALVGCALERGGWRTAVLSSPHVESLTERVRIDGQPIGEAPLANALDAALEARAAAEARGSDGGGASWFDVFVAASLLACAEARVGWAVVECGLGGRRDSTNVLGAEVAVLTSVELEHTEVLGDTLEAIAAEKAAIAAEGGALLACVPLRLAPVLHEEARRQRARSVTRLPPSEDRDADNLELARLALDELGRRGAATAAGCDGRPRLGRRLLGPDEVRRARRRLPARYEPLESPCGVAVRLDAAHTAASAAKLVRSIASGGGDEAAKPPVLLVGMLDDKDHAAVGAALRALAPPHATVCDLPGGGGAGARAAGEAGGAATLCKALSAGGVAVDAAADIGGGLVGALAAARRHGTWLLVAGSFRLCGAVRPLLRKRRDGADGA